MNFDINTIADICRPHNEKLIAEGGAAKAERALDIAWAEINAIGGCASSEYEEGVNFAVGQALTILERLGAQDPLVRPRR